MLDWSDLSDSIAPICKRNADGLANITSRSISFTKPTSELLGIKSSYSQATDKCIKALDECKAVCETFAQNLKAPDFYTPLRIVPEGRKTVVFWKDGTATYVTCGMDEIDDFSIYTAFCAALAKKIFGATGTVKRICDEHNVQLIKEREEERKLLEQLEREEAEAKAKARRERKRIKRLAKKQLEDERIKKAVEDKVWEMKRKEWMNK